MLDLDAEPVRLLAIDPPRTREECELRVLRSLATMRAPGVCKGVYQGARSGWPSYLYEPEDILAQQELVEDDPPEQFVPKRRDLTDWLTASLWWAQIDQPRERPPGRRMWTVTPEQRVIWRRSWVPARSWQQIADSMRTTTYRVQRLYDHGIDRCWNVARFTR